MHNDNLGVVAAGKFSKNGFYYKAFLHLAILRHYVIRKKLMTLNREKRNLFPKQRLSASY